MQRLGFFFYWIFDNIQLLANIKFINADPSFHLKLASLGWCVGLIFGIARNLYDIFDQLQKKEEENKKQKIIFNNIVDIIGKLGDLLSALNGLGVPEKVLGKPFNDGLLGIGGFVAALISLSKIYPKKS